MRRGNKSKNILIGGLLVIVLLITVAFAAFSTSLNITGNASITSSWNVGFDTTKQSGSGVIATTGTATAGSITYANAQSASFSPSFVKPGDSVTYTLTIKNTGTLAASLGTPTLTSSTCTVSGLTCTTSSGHIKFTVTAPASSSLAASGTTTMTVKAEFVNAAVSSSTTESATLTVSVVATQA